jgi:hypothetical protein
MNTEWEQVRCEFYENKYWYNDKGQIRNNLGKILKSNKSGTHVLLTRTINKIPYKRLFKIDTLINTDEYLKEIGYVNGKREEVKAERSADRFKKVKDSRVRSCSLKDINTLNLV